MGGKKKKKGTKKKKGSKEKKPEEEKKTIFEIPEYIDPKIYTPQVQLTIKLATPPNDHLNKYLNLSAQLIKISVAFKITARTTTRIEEIERKIIEQHDGSIKNVTICQSVYTKEQILDPKKRLCDVGITTAGSYTLIYDFQPVSYPLLTTAIPESTFQNVK